MISFSRGWRLMMVVLTMGWAGPLVSHGQETPKREVDLLLVTGASGAEEYHQKFQAQIQHWSRAVQAAGITLERIGETSPSPKKPDAEMLKERLRALAGKAGGQLWVVLIGHGTFDGREAKFNLRGPDVTPQDLAQALKDSPREVVLIHTGSASGGFIKPLAGPKRVLVTATKGGDEVYYCRFGEYFAPAIAGLPEADLDQDKQVSVLEAFLYASKRANEFYEKEGRLATEHALIEDNGDGLGSRAETFDGLQSKATDTAKTTLPDGARSAQVALVLNSTEARLPSHLLERRDRLELQLEQLKRERAKMPADGYYTALEKLLKELAEVYR